MLAGPYTTMILADLGAEVVKIEQPKTGDITRNLLKDDPKYSLDGIGAYHLTLGRNKKSVELDLKSEEGLKLFKELAEVADVVVDNFSQGVTKRLGIDHQSLKEVNPKIITCSISGFGDTEVNRPAYDNLIQGYAGAMSITGSDKENPVKSGIPIADLGAGLYAVIGILSAIQSRDKNDSGEHVDISLSQSIERPNLLSWVFIVEIFFSVHTFGSRLFSLAAFSAGIPKESHPIG